jgi:CPA2 family monovalent cation:H+ antiporter-2
VALRTGLYLAQAGEFGFVLLTLGAEHGLVRRADEPHAGGMVLSMLATPFIMMYSNRIVMKLSASDWLHAVAADDHHRTQVHPHRGKHVIICGYGRSGQNLARMLDTRHPLHGAGPGPRPRAPGRRRRPFVVYGDAARLQA